MDNDNITVTNTKDNTLQFDLNIEGVDPSTILARFVVETSDMCLSFKANRMDDDTWEVTVPSMPFVERTTYPFYIEVVADGYYFTPHKGIINVVGPVEIYISTPKNTTLSPTTKYNGIKETTKLNDKSNKPSASRLSAMIMQDNERTKPVTEKLMEHTDNKKSSGTKDDVVKDILKKTLNFQGVKKKQI